MAIREEKRVLLHSLLVSIMDALAVKFEGGSKASQAAALLERLKAVPMDVKILDDAVRYCTDARCLGLTMA